MKGIVAFLAGLLAFLALTGTAAAGDLAHVDRTLRKEPAYKGTPRYALLVFGPEAKSRVWIVEDDHVLYVDRNGNGDLTEEGERFEDSSKAATSARYVVPELQVDGLTHKNLTVSYSRATADYVGASELARIKKIDPEGRYWAVGVQAERPASDTRTLPRHIGYIANGDGLGFLALTASPKDAPIIHFNGPWTLGLQDIKQKLTRKEPTNLQIGVGTQGTAPGTFSFVLYTNNTIPQDAYPVVEVAFPSASAGGPPIRETFTFKKRC